MSGAVPRLRKRERVRSGILRAPRRDWPRHRRHVRSFECVVAAAGGEGCRGPIRCCHIRTAANSGTGLKPADWDTFPGCDAHHDEQHAKGALTFNRKYGIDVWEIAAMLVRTSPDLKMRQARAA